MRRQVWLLLCPIVLFLGSLSCDRSPTASTGILDVRVTAIGDGGVADKRVEVRGTSQTDWTDEHGRAQFVLPAGRYVVRVYEINQGGPGLPYVEETVDVGHGRTTSVEFIDCPECVSLEIDAGPAVRMVI
ncbi:MAG TPA: hypothetical protein VF827_04690 [Syntrophales bacterium]